MLRLFDEEMEKMDLVSARFPDRHVHKFVDRPAAPPRPTGVRGTYSHLSRGNVVANMLG